MFADDLVADVYEAIRANPTLWEDTLFLITYDECGGYWDSELPSGPLTPVRSVFTLHFLLKCTQKGAIPCNFY